MAIVESIGVVSEGKLAAVVIFTLIAGIIIGIFVGFLIWKAQIIQLPLHIWNSGLRNTFGFLTARIAF